MSYYDEIDRDLNEESDELFKRLETIRWKKNQNQNSKKKSNCNTTVDGHLEKSHQPLFDTSHMILEQDNDNDVEMSVGNSSEESEKETTQSGDSYHKDRLNDNFYYSLSAEEIDNVKESPLLFKNSRLNVRKFSILFMATVDKLGIAEDKRDMVLELIRYSLPINNELPLTYHMIAKIIPKPEISSFLLCKICNQEISSSKYTDSEEEKKKFKRTKTLKKCLNEDCASNRIGLKSKSFVKVFSLNIFSQLKIILENNEKCIKSNIGINHYHTLKYVSNFLKFNLDVFKRKYEKYRFKYLV